MTSTKAFLAVAFITALVASLPLAMAAESAATKAAWTHMVYLHSDNDLEYFALQDLGEMTKLAKYTGGAKPALNLIVLVDRMKPGTGVVLSFFHSFIR